MRVRVGEQNAARGSSRAQTVAAGVAALLALSGCQFEPPRYVVGGGAAGDAGFFSPDLAPRGDADEPDVDVNADAEPVDLGEADLGAAPDAEPVDLGFAPDAEPRDALPTDLTPVDTGVLPDTGVVDTGPRDAGPRDTGPRDTGVPADTGIPPDTGVPPDSGIPPDSGVTPDAGVRPDAACPQAPVWAAPSSPPAPLLDIPLGFVADLPVLAADLDGDAELELVAASAATGEAAVVDFDDCTGTPVVEPLVMRILGTQPPLGAAGLALAQTPQGPVVVSAQGSALLVAAYTRNLRAFSGASQPIAIPGLTIDGIAGAPTYRVVASGELAGLRAVGIFDALQGPVTIPLDSSALRAPPVMFDDGGGTPRFAAALSGGYQLFDATGAGAATSFALGGTLSHAPSALGPGTIAGANVAVLGTPSTFGGASMRALTAARLDGFLPQGASASARTFGFNGGQPQVGVATAYLQPGSPGAGGFFYTTGGNAVVGCIVAATSQPMTCTQLTFTLPQANDVATNVELLTAYVGGTAPDLVLTSRTGAIHVLTNGLTPRFAQPIRLAAAQNVTATGAIVPHFFSRWGLDASALFVPTTQSRLVLVGWRRPVGAGPDDVLWTQARGGPTRSGSLRP